MISICFVFIVYKILGIDIDMKAHGSSASLILLSMGIISDLNIAATILTEVLL